MPPNQLVSLRQKRMERALSSIEVSALAPVVVNPLMISKYASE